MIEEWKKYENAPKGSTNKLKNFNRIAFICKLITGG